MAEAAESSDDSDSDSVEEISDSDEESENDGGLSKRKNGIKKVFKRRNLDVGKTEIDTVPVLVPLPMPKNAATAEDTYQKLLDDSDSDDPVEIIDQPIKNPLTLPPPKL